MINEKNSFKIAYVMPSRDWFHLEGDTWKMLNNVI